MSRKKLLDIIDTLEIRLKHLRNDYLLTKDEYEDTTRKYLEILAELKDKNRQLLDFQRNLEETVSRRTEQLEQTKKILQQKSEELQIMVDSSPSMIFYKDNLGRYVRVNKAFSDLIGFPLKKITGKTDAELFPGEAKHFAQDDVRVVQTGKRVVNKEVTLKTKKGERFLLVDKIPFRNADGEIIGIIGFALDVTERRQLEEEQNKASKIETIGILAGGIAHDFNNILTSVMMNISLANIYTKKNKLVKAKLMEAEKAALRAGELTKQLLTFSKGGAPIKKAVSLGALLKESSGFALRGSNVKCSCTFAEGLWAAEADEGQIIQVINNLIINADQAMPEGGTIRLRAENVRLGPGDNPASPEGRFVRIVVEDEGCGIPRENLPKIFDPYFTTKKEGSGLGLASSYSIIEKHGGHIEVDSELGVGTRFQVFLPAASGQPGRKKDVQRQLLGEKGKILIMDDDLAIRSVVAEMLKLIGHEVEAVGDGMEAVESYKKAKDSSKPFDAVIMDLTIPGAQGGKEAIRKLLEIDPEVKAIVSSGYAEDPVLSEFRKYGFSGIVPKPYRLEKLKEVLSEVIGVRGK
ncbi:MAG: PAS domain-containing protein [Candidatus Glassbacteria bacterium]|nr:PAS domain-containing protein [Candidatus Glassbacteria bacterium]